jgi:tetratricopeptide (TPR) repeat protein
VLVGAPADPGSPELAAAEAAAFEALRRGELEIAANHFEAAQALATSVPGQARLAFNAALCAHQLHQWARVRALLLRGPRGLPEAELARFHLLLGEAEAALGNWEGAGGSFAAGLVLSQAKDPGAELQAGLLLGDARVKFAAGRLHEAQGLLEDATTLLLDATPLRQQRGHELLARVFYHHALIYQRLCRAVKLRLPVERMTRDLSLKRSLFKKSEELFMLGVQVRHQVWSIRCGHALGVLAEDFAADLQASELPPDLDEDARRLYFQELEPYVLAVQREALGYYEKTDRLARRLGFTGPWVERNQRALATLRKALESQPQ